MKTLVSFLVILSLLFSIELCSAAQLPEVVVVSSLPEASMEAPNAAPPAGAPAPARGRPIGLITAPQNVTSQTSVTIEPASSQSTLDEPPQLLGLASTGVEFLLTGFDGGLGNLAPADIGGAVGPHDVVSALNDAYYFHTKSGSLKKSVTGDMFWCSGSLPGCPNTHSGDDLDPRIVYDFGAQRWITSALAGGGSAAVTTWLAVSQT